MSLLILAVIKLFISDVITVSSFVSNASASVAILISSEFDFYISLPNFNSKDI
nr:MAG TPA: hypothetical protein [Caudoviricetes sp.]